MTDPAPANAAQPPIGCGGKLMLFVPVWLLGSFVSIFLIYWIFQATGPKGPDSGMGNGLGAVMLAPVGGFLAGWAALGWQAKYDRTGERSGKVASICLGLFVLAIILGNSLFV